MRKPTLAIHGGAGILVKGMMTPEKETEYKQALEKALSAGYQILETNGSAIDALEASVKELENSHLFNAGKGSVYTASGTHEMDASIMDGSNRNAGAVSIIKGIKNPVTLAKAVMLQSDHVFLASDGAMEFAKNQGFKIEDETYFHDDFRYQQWQEIKDTDSFQLDHVKKDSKFGTVGAVACDAHGNLAAATSTGGMTKR